MKKNSVKLSLNKISISKLNNPELIVGGEVTFDCQTSAAGCGIWTQNPTDLSCQATQQDEETMCTRDS